LGSIAFWGLTTTAVTGIAVLLGTSFVVLADDIKALNRIASAWQMRRSRSFNTLESVELAGAAAFPM
jgi:hypothetical protein